MMEKATDISFSNKASTLKPIHDAFVCGEWISIKSVHTLNLKIKVASHSKNLNLT